MAFMRYSEEKLDQAGPRTGTDPGPAIMRRVAIRIIPILLLSNFIAYLDRTNVSFAALEMNRDLGFTPSVYGLGAGLYFITYCLFEVPSNLILYRIGPVRWIARIMLTWGVIAACMAFVVGSNSFFALRLLLGAAEAGLFPGLLYFLTLWFPAAYRARVVGFVVAGVAFSGIIGAPLSGWLLSLDGTAGLRGWQWLFIVEGLPAVIVSALWFFYLRDDPSKVTWLGTAERTWLTGSLRAEALARARGGRQAGSGLAALRNPLVLFLSAMYFSNVCLLNGIAFFLPLILKGFGLNNLQVGYIGAIPSVIGLGALLWWGRRSDMRGERYGHAAFANLLAGCALLASVSIDDPVARIVLITVAFASTISFPAPFWAIPPTFLSGAAAASGFAVISSIGVLGGFVAPTLIGYIGSISGSFRIGLGVVGSFAIIMGLALYLVGLARREGNAASPTTL
jgi:MFS family permease